MRDIDLDNPKGLPETAIKLKYDAEKQIHLALLAVASLAILVVFGLVIIILLQVNQNNKINQTLKNLRVVADQNHALNENNNENTRKFSNAVINMEKQLNAVRGVDNETLYRVRQIEVSMLGYLPPVPDAVIRQGQITPDFGGSYTYSGNSNYSGGTPRPVFTPRPSPQPQSERSPSPSPSPGIINTPKPLPSTTISPAHVPPVPPKNIPTPTPTPTPNPTPTKSEQCFVITCGNASKV